MMHLWLKAGHIIFVIAWMSGLMMYPRLKIYQLQDKPGSKQFETMKLAAIRLRRIILTPALTGTWGFGLAMLIHRPEYLSQHWLQVKLSLVVILTFLHGFFIRLGRQIDDTDRAMASHRLRQLNEIPFLLMIGIILLVVLKPM